MEMKTTKCYCNHLMEKYQTWSWPTQQNLRLSYTSKVLTALCEKCNVFQPGNFLRWCNWKLLWAMSKNAINVGKQFLFMQDMYVISISPNVWYFKSLSETSWATGEQGLSSGIKALPSRNPISLRNTLLLVWWSHPFCSSARIWGYMILFWTQFLQRLHFILLWNTCFCIYYHIHLQQREAEQKQT